MNDDILHEGKCKRCGRCCLLKVTVQGKTFALGKHYCPHLDPVSKLCTVYANRFEKTNGYCASHEKAIRDGLFPPDCPYAKEDPNYKSSVDVWVGDRDGKAKDDTRD